MGKYTNREFIKYLREKVNPKTPKVFKKSEEDFTIVVPEEVNYIKSYRGKVTFYLTDGTTQTTIESIAEVKEKFNDCPEFISGDENSLINSKYLRNSTYASGEYQLKLRMSDLEYVRVTPYNAKKFCEALDIVSLRYCQQYRRMMLTCQRFNIRLFDDDIRQFSKERLLSEFCDSNGNFLMTNLYYNQIWQVYNWIINGELPEDEIFMGNIRSFWYTYLKPVLSVLNKVQEKYYGDMIEAFTKFTVDWKLFNYKEWDFLDVKRYNKKLGKKKRIYLILVAEKEGQLRLLEHIHGKHDITTIALGGEPSVLSLEYFVDDLEEAGINKEKRFHVFFATDYDPVGHNIQKTFLQKLKRHGIKNVAIHDLVTLDRFTPEEIETSKYNLLEEENDSQNWLTRAKKWVYKTGGIGDGNTWRDRAYGMEADAIAPGKMVKLFEEEAKPYLK